MTYRELEAYLYAYRELCVKEEALREVMRLLDSGGDVHGQKWSGVITDGGLPGSPVSMWYEACEKCGGELERIARITEGIRRMREDLRERSRYSPKCWDMLGILEAVYMAGVSFGEYVRGRDDERTQYRRRRELVMMTGEYICGEC